MGNKQSISSTHSQSQTYKQQRQTFSKLIRMGFNETTAFTASQKYPSNVDNAVYYILHLKVKQQQQKRKAADNINVNRKRMQERYQTIEETYTSTNVKQPSNKVNTPPQISKARKQSNKHKINNFQHNPSYEPESQTDDHEIIYDEKCNESFEYLLILYIFKIRHKDDKQYIKHANCIQTFKKLIENNININNYNIITDEIIISLNSMHDIFMDQFNKINDINNSSFNYLIKLYQRCIDFELNQIAKNWINIISKKRQFNFTSTIKSFVCKQTCLILSSSEMSNQKSQHQFRHLLVQPALGRQFPNGFLHQLFAQECSVKLLLGNFMNMIQNISFNVSKSNYRQSLDALLKLSSIQQFAIYFVHNKYWIPEMVTVKQMKDSWLQIHGTQVKNSIFGGLLCLGFETPDLCSQFDAINMNEFTNAASVQVKAGYALQDFRLTINDLQDGIYKICHNMLTIKNCKCIKDSMIRLFGYYIYINLDRAKTQFDTHKIASDGFLLNLNSVLLKLFEPAIDKNLIHKLDSRYFLINKYHNFMSWENSIRLGCDSEQLTIMKEILYNDPDSISFKFSTKLFCLTLESLHIGFASVMKGYLQSEREISRLRLHANNNNNNPYLQDLLVVAQQKLLAQSAHIFDPKLMKTVGKFYGFFCRYLLYLSGDKRTHIMDTVSTTKTDKNSMEIKLDDIKMDDTHETPGLLSIMPEHYISDMIIFFRSYLTDPVCVSQMKYRCPFNKRAVIACLLYLVGEHTPIRNIYHRSSVLEILYYLLPIQVQRSFNGKKVYACKLDSFIGHEYNQLPECKQYFISILLSIYNDVEKSGFHEKFVFRTDIAKILKFLFSYKWHQNNLLTFWDKQKEKFIGFLNVLINDLIYALDHGFEGIKEIKKIEDEQKQQQQQQQEFPNGDFPMPANNMNQIGNNYYNDIVNENQIEDEKKDENENDPRQQLQTLLELKNKVRVYMSLANQSMELFQFVCNNICEPFMNDLIVPRIAILVSVYIDKLSYGSDLRVKDNLREHYQFDAKYLLSSIVEIFNKLCDNNKENTEKFLNNIVEYRIYFEENSYIKAINVLRQKNIMDFNSINSFESKLSVILKKIEEKKRIEKILEPIPSKYLDPVMQELMSDPVILGKKIKHDDNKENDGEEEKNDEEDNKNDCQYVMDRKVIERHLMNQQNNPFTREPLTKNELIPYTELKHEIKEWVKSKLNKENDNNTKQQRENTDV